MVPSRSPARAAGRLVARANRATLRRVQIEVNGEPKQVKDGVTVRALLEVLGLGNTLVAVERNEEIVPRAEHANCSLAAGDRIEVVELVGGG